MNMKMMKLVVTGVLGLWGLGALGQSTPGLGTNEVSTGQSGTPQGCGNPKPPTTPPCVTEGDCPECKMPPTPDKVNVPTGDSMRNVTDLKVFGAVGQLPLEWKRYGHSRLNNGAKWFGHGHIWRHSYQWEMTGSGSSRTIYHPDGSVWGYTLVSGVWRTAKPQNDHVLSQAGTVYTLRSKKGTRYTFNQLGSGTGTYYQCSAITDSQGNTTTLTYDGSKRLSRVTEPGGRWMDVAYQDIAFNNEAFTTLASAVNPGSNVWTEVIVSNTNLFRYIRFYTGGDATANNWCNVGEIELYDANSNLLTGTAFGTSPAWNNSGNTFGKAWDGNTNTFFDYAYVHFGFTGLDLGTSQRVARIRYFPRIGYASRLAGGLFQGANIAPAAATVIASVTANDGRAVNYSYATVPDQVLGDDFVVLNLANYGDGTSAAYNHAIYWPGQRPLLVDATDPRAAEGTAPRMKTEYWLNGWVYGAIYRHKNPATGTQMAKFEGSGGYGSHDYKVTFANGAVVRQIDGGDGNITQHTDALGRISSATYSSNNTGFLLSETDPLGRVTTFERDAQDRVLRKVHPDGGVEGWSYDANGQVLSHTNELGNVTIWQRDSLGRATNVVYADGSSEGFTFNGFGQVTEHRMRNGGVEFSNYDATGLKTNAVDALGNVTTYAYNSNSLLASVTDARGNTTAMEYDERGQVVKVTNADGTFRTFAYDRFGNRTNTVDELGHVSSTSYDESNRVVAQTDPLGRTTTFAYDIPGGAGGGCGCGSSQNKPTSIVSPGSNVTKIVYDLEWQKTSETVAFGTAIAATTTYQYDTAGNLIAMTDPRGKIWTTGYDAENRRISSTDPLGNVTTWDYDDAGNRTLQVDANGKFTFWTYDVLNRVTSEIRKVGDVNPAADGDDAVTTYAYDSAGNMVAVTDPNGNKTGYGYDLLGRRFVTTNAAGEVSATFFDSVGNVCTNVAANGNVTTYTYDNRNRAVLIADATGTVAVTVYDAAGRRVSQSDGNGNSVSNVYDAAGQLVRVVDALGNVASNTYSVEGNLLVSFDRLGRATSHAYDARNRRVSTTDALNNTTVFTYDPNGNLTVLTDANNNSTAYGYDGANRRTNEVYADGGVRAYSYDAVGNLTSRTDPAGRTAVNTYNDLYFLTQHATAGFPADNFAYDKGGRMVSAERNGWIVTNTYDAVNRVVSSVQNGKTVSYSYNVAAGTRTVTYPGGRVVTENRDLRNRLGSLTDSGGMIASFSYDGGDRVSSRGYRNGTSAAYVYDANNRILSLVHTLGGTTIAGFTQGYDAEGNKLFENKTHDAAKSEAYAYDLISQLTDYRVGTLSGSSIPSPTLQKNYTLDPVGNWNQVWSGGAPPPSTETRTHNNVNEITAINGTNLTHDANGNLTNDGTKAMDYDEENRLIRVTRIADSQILGEYAYDALGRRILSAAFLGGTTNNTCFLFDGLRVLEDQDCAAGTTLATYTYGNYIDEVLTMTRGANTYYYHHNTLWSAQALTDNSGVTIERYSYDSYGAPSFFDASGSPISNSSISNRYLFTGREHDAESGLYHYRARSYDPLKGRFMQRDPLTFLGGLEYYGRYTFNSRSALWMKSVGRSKRQSHSANINVYLAFNGEPIGQLDPTGLEVVGPPSPCELYKSKYGTSGERGFVICLDGQRYGCVWPENFTPKLTDPGLLKCASAHELKHAEDTSIKCDACKGMYAPRNSDAAKPGETEEQTERRIECPARKSQCDCLEAWYKNISEMNEELMRQYLDQLQLCRKWKGPCGLTNGNL